MMSWSSGKVGMFKYAVHGEVKSSIVTGRGDTAVMKIKLKLFTNTL